MNKVWYYTRNGARFGPISAEELKQLAASGQLTPTDLLWKAGMPNWEPASRVKGLFATTASAMPPAMPPGPAPAMPPLPVPAPVPVSMPQAPPGAATAAVGPKPGMTLWTYLLLAGAGLLFLAFLTPWWSIKRDHSERKFSAGKEFDEESRLEKKKRLEKEEIELEKEDRFLEENRNNYLWYVDHLGQSKLDHGFTKAILWGWNTGPGLTGFLLSFVIAGLIVPPFFVPVLARWAWIGALISALFGFLVFLLSMIWFFRAPGESMSGVLSQGVSIGLWASMIGSLLVLVGGIRDSLPALKSFTDKMNPHQPLGGVQPQPVPTLPPPVLYNRSLCRRQGREEATALSRFPRRGAPRPCKRAARIAAKSSLWQRTCEANRRSAASASMFSCCRVHRQCWSLRRSLPVQRPLPTIRERHSRNRLSPGHPPHPPQAAPGRLLPNRRHKPL